MSVKDPTYKHLFRFVKGKIIFNKPEMWELMKQSLKADKVYYITVEEEDYVPTDEQNGFLFGGIYRSECMNSNAFSGLKEREIHQIMMKELRSYPKTFVDKAGNEVTMDFVDDFKKYGKKKKAMFIDELIMYLQTEYQIEVKDPKEYKLNKYQKKI